MREKERKMSIDVQEGQEENKKESGQVGLWQRSSLTDPFFCWSILLIKFWMNEMKATETLNLLAVRMGDAAETKASSLSLSLSLSLGEYE